MSIHFRQDEPSPQIPRLYAGTLSCSRTSLDLLDASGDRPAVLTLERQGLEDQRIERSLWKVETVTSRADALHFYRNTMSPPDVEVQRERSCDEAERAAMDVGG